MKKIVYGVCLVAIAVMAVLLLIGFPGVVTVTAASLPNHSVGQGEAVLFRTAISVEGMDVPVERIACSFQKTGNVRISNLRWYDETNGVILSGASYYSSEGKILFWPGWPAGENLKVSEGTIRIISLRGNVSGKGTLLFQVEEMVVKNGVVEGVPTATTSLTVN